MQIYVYIYIYIYVYINITFIHVYTNIYKYVQDIYKIAGRRPGGLDLGPGLGPRHCLTGSGGGLGLDPAPAIV